MRVVGSVYCCLVFEKVALCCAQHLLTVVEGAKVYLCFCVVMKGSTEPAGMCFVGHISTEVGNIKLHTLGLQIHGQRGIIFPKCISWGR